MQFLKKHAITTLYVVIAIALAFLGYRLFGESAKVSDIMLFAVFSSALLVMPLVETGDKILKKLGELEPKTGNGPCSVSPVDSLLHRHDLERTLASALGPYLVNNHKAKDLGAYLRDAVDAMLSVGGAIKMKCTLPESRGCNCAKVFGNGSQAAAALADQQADAEIATAGLTAPRVTAKQVQALMDSVTWRYEHEEGSRHTFAHAFLGDFYLATGHNAPVSRENFDPALGMKYAREQGEGKARDKLWELEGYKLHSAMAGQ